MHFPPQPGRAREQRDSKKGLPKRRVERYEIFQAQVDCEDDQWPKETDWVLRNYAGAAQRADPEMLEVITIAPSSVDGFPTSFRQTCVRSSFPRRLLFCSMRKGEC